MSDVLNKFVVSEDQDKMRLDHFLVECLGESRSKIQKLIKENRVFINNIVAKKTGVVMRPGNNIEIHAVIETKEENTVEEEFIDEALLYKQIEILKEAKEYLVVVKPAGLLIHPTMAQEPVTLSAWLVEKYPELKNVGENPVRPGIVHRLDKAASGVLVVARTQKMFLHLKKQFMDREVEKEYTVLVHGEIENDYAEITFPIDRGHDGKMVARPVHERLTLSNIKTVQPGKISKTEIWVKERYLHATLLQVRIHSGRTHQIRVHLNAFTKPVVGDVLYMQKQYAGKLPLDRLFLHARRLVFKDLEGDIIENISEIPQQLSKFLTTLKK